MRFLQSHIAKIILLTVLFFALGRVSLLLAIPPARSMAIYLPAGLAIAALLIGGMRLLPGVFLGSFIFVLSIDYENKGQLGNAEALFSFLIACGASLQAGVGAFLVRRFIRYPAPMDGQRAIIGLFILIGPITCLINASLGTAILYEFGMIPGSHFISTWFVWWTGDALGAVLITPIALILFGQPRSVWHSRRSSALLPLLITSIAVICAFLYVREWEQKEFKTEFRDTAQRISNALQARLDYHVEIQKSVVSLFGSSEHVTRKQFAHFIAQPVTAYASVQAIEWAPRIAHAARASFEQQIKQDGLADFAIKEKQGKQLVAATQRAEYFPITYAAPVLGNEMVMGFDLASEPSRRQTIQDACDLGLPVASEPINLMQSLNDSPSSLLISAVYASNRPSNTKVERKQAFIGIVTTVLKVGDALDDLLQESDKRNIQIRLRGDGGTRAPYFDNSIKPGTMRNPLFTATLNLAGREITLAAHPAPAYYAEHQSWAAWSTMVVGMLFTALVSMYLLLISARSYSIEALVTERTRELHDSEHRLHAILDNAAEGILSFDGNGQILFDNRAARQLLGQEHLLGRHFSTLFRENGQAMLPPNANDPGMVSHASKASHDAHDAHVLREVTGIRPDGSEIDLGMSLASFQRNQQMLTIVIIHDLTEKKRIERLKGEFVSTVSHELRTPLTSIRGALGLMAGGAVGVVPAPMQKLMDLAKDNAERLSTLINDILDFEKLEYGGMTFQLETHSLFKLVTAAIESNLGYAEKFSIRLVLLNTEDAHWQVTTDANRLIQILSNLISNAIKFSHPNEQVDIHITAQAARVKVWVIDHGIGIGDSFKKQIFAKFSQEDGSGQRKYGGTGLGLSLAKTMIEKMGGTIGFDSVEGQGSRFFIELALIQMDCPVPA